MQQIIDFRVRPPYKSFKNEWFFGDEVLEQFQSQSGREVGLSAREMSMERFMNELDASNIVHAVVTGRNGFGQANAAVPGVENADVAELVAEFKGRFIGVIAANAANASETLEDIDKYVAKGPCSGVAIEPAFSKINMRFDDKSLYPIYERCEQENIFVILTAGVMYDRLYESDPHAFDNLANDFPKLRFVLSHAGWPWVVPTCWVALKHKNVYIMPDFYMYEAPGRADYVYAINTMLRSQSIYASAYPLVSLATAVECNINCGIKEAVLSDFMYNNAAKLLGI